MTVEQFLSAVLPSQGYRFALASFGQQGDPDFRPGQRNFGAGQNSELIAYCNWGSAKGANAFFAVAGYELVTNDKGTARRIASAARWHRCLRLDIDVGAKGYADRRTALAAVLQFTAAYQMPMPWIVDSGGGFHVYYAFDRDIELAEWQGYAARLHAATQAYGLQCDSTTTQDAARILRLPGTLNNKPHFVQQGMPPVVRVLQAGASVDPAAVVAQLPMVAGAVALGNMALPPSLRAMAPVASELQANMHPTYFMAEVVRGCPGMAATLASGGADAAEPLWKLTLDLVNKSEDDDATKWQYAIDLSKGHPGFSPEGLMAKWQQVVQQDYHPPTCARLNAAGLAQCAACPYNGKISSPLVLGRPALPAPESDAAIPPPPPAPTPPAPQLVTSPASAGPVVLGIFCMHGDGRITIVDGKLTSRLSITNGYPTVLVDTKPDEQGVRRQYQRKLLEYRMLGVERMLDAVGRRSVVVLTFDRHLDGKASIEFDNNDFAEPKRFYNKMSAEGLYCNRKDATDFVDHFMSEFLSQLQRARAANQIAGRCGWTDDMQGFVLGTQLYRRGGAVDPIRTSVAPAEMEGYHARGDVQAWREAFDITLSGGADRQCVLALSIAGPLMVFTGLDGVMLSAYSPESGVGKSTLCDAALSIWGDPNVLRKDFRDTANATFKLASVTGNMPMVIDEFTNVDGRALSDYVYTLTQGREKHRLSSDSQLTKNSGQRWCLAAITTSNNSVHEKLQRYRNDATAEAARVFELRLHPLPLAPERMGEVKSKLLQLHDSYGHLGPQLVQVFLGKTPEQWRELVMARVSKWDRMASQSAGDRFRSATCALIEIGAIIGKALGFAFDPAAVEQELLRHWRKQVDEFEAERKRPMDFINAYVLANLNEFAMIGGPKGDQLINPNTPRRFMGEVRGVTANGAFRPDTVMIPFDMLRDFIHDRNGNFKSTLEWLQGASAVTRMGRLLFLAGTTHQIHTQAVELRHADVIGQTRPSPVVASPSPLQKVN